ncbi:MAG: hypothetical protein JWL64_2679, partial [Frankiales bacterium]|nr:hypothetical protein [Frankiales bacterium]
CTFPGCPVSAARCDLDHVTAWAKGGPTTVSNLQSLCRHHHRLKHDGWQVTHTDHGTTTTWTSPRRQVGSRLAD